MAHINGEYGSLDFIPVHHYHQTIKKDEFYALLSVADLALITPLRDGMNTTSMEFVICQQRTGMSPIVLSEFMGTSHHMKQALCVPLSFGTFVTISEFTSVFHRFNPCGEISYRAWPPSFFGNTPSLIRLITTFGFADR